MVQSFLGIFSDSPIKQSAEKSIDLTENDDITLDSFFQHNELHLFTNLFAEENVYVDDELIVLFHGHCYNIKDLQKRYHLKNEINPPLAKIFCELFKKGKTDIFSHIRGDFSLIIFDRTSYTIYGVRDPFGKKSLYYSHVKNRLFFANDQRILSSYIPSKEINEEAVQHYFSFQYIPEPMTMNRFVLSVPPGSFFKKQRGEELEIISYWKPSFRPIYLEKHECISEIRRALQDSVEAHLEEEVPIGAYLSGGIDSTFIVSLARQVRPDIQTFSVGFEREGYSEIEIAKRTADELNVEHVAKIISPEEYVEELPKIIWYLGEPFADPSCVPLYFVAKTAKEHVDISLSGEGADELFAGYNIYLEPKSLKPFQYLPRGFCEILANLAKLLPDNVKGKSFLQRGTTPLAQRYIGNAKIFEEEEKREIFKLCKEEVSYRQLTAPLFAEVNDLDPVTQMQYIDLHTWLPGNILLKAEQMARANNLDVRMPFLDQKVFQVAKKIPCDMKLSNKQTKYILRKAAKGIVPDHVLDQKKLGFPVPIRHWIKNELNSWIKTLIKESNTDEFLDKDSIFALIDEHCRGRADNSRKIWTIVTLILWFQIFIEKKYPC